jgi:hypothetical protein
MNTSHQTCAYRRMHPFGRGTYTSMQIMSPFARQRHLPSPVENTAPGPTFEQSIEENA